MNIEAIKNQSTCEIKIISYGYWFKVMVNSNIVFKSKDVKECQKYMDDLFVKLGWV